MTERGYHYFDRVLGRRAFVPFDCARCHAEPAIWVIGKTGEYIGDNCMARGERAAAQSKEG